MPRKKPLSMNPVAVASREKRARQRKANLTNAEREALIAKRTPEIKAELEALHGHSEDEAPGQLFQAESAPEQTFESKGVMQDILGALGLSKQSSTPGNKVPVNLNKKQHEFVDNVTPIGSSVLIASLAWAWGRLGEPYRQCAPDEAVATRIVEPLIRIYARQAKFIESLDPNTADWLASLSATVGYGLTSLSMFDYITAQLRAEEEAHNNGRATFARTYESNHSSANNGRPHTESPHDAAREQVVASASPVDLSNLSERERSSYEALSKLRDRDIAARQRRSGQYGLS